MKEQRGITLVALIMTVIILIIIASISIYEGRTAIVNAKIQTFETNMLIIKAKAKEYGEEIDAELWAYSEDEETEEEKKTELLAEYGFVESSISSTITAQLDSELGTGDIEVYSIEQLLIDNGLSELQEDTSDGEYLVVYSADDYTKVDVVYTGGISYDEGTYYTLSALQEVYSED